MNEEICEQAERLHIPRSTIATVAGVQKSSVTMYFKAHQVSAATANKIERAIRDISTMVVGIQEHVGLALPLDLGNAGAVKSGVEGMRRAAEETEQQVRGAFDALLEGAANAE